MADKYLKIMKTGDTAGTVSNIVMMETTDTFDPDFIWTLVPPDAPHPGIGFTTPYDTTPIITGTATTFDPFVLSAASGGFTVSYDGTNINISCLSFDMNWLRNELTMLCKNGMTKGTLAYAGRDGVLYQDYCIVWDDSNKILAAMETLS